MSRQKECEMHSASACFVQDRKNCHSWKDVASQFPFVFFSNLKNRLSSGKRPPVVSPA